MSSPAAPGNPPRVQERDRDGSRVRFFYRFSRYYCRLTFLLAFRGQVFGARRVPQRGGVLLACNHQSFLDPILAALPMSRECAFMGRDTLFANPAFRRLIESLNCFPVKRGTADVGAIKESLRRLKQGYALVTFPEGTRSSDGSIGPMMPGSILIARKARVPIVPTLISGAYECWPRDAVWPRLGRIIVAYGDPITPEQQQRLGDEGCVERVRNVLLALQKRYAI